MNLKQNLFNAIEILRNILFKSEIILLIVFLRIMFIKRYFSRYTLAINLPDRFQSKRKSERWMGGGREGDERRIIIF